MDQNRIIKYSIYFSLFFQITSANAAGHNRLRTEFSVVHGDYTSVGSFVIENFQVKNPGKMKLLSFNLAFTPADKSLKEPFNLKGLGKVLRFYTGLNVHHPMNPSGYPAIVLKIETDINDLSSLNRNIQHIILFPTRNEIAFLGPAEFPTNMQLHPVNIVPAIRGNFTRSVGANAQTSIEPEDEILVAKVANCEPGFNPTKNDDLK